MAGLRLVSWDGTQCDVVQLSARQVHPQHGLPSVRVQPPSTVANITRLGGARSNAKTVWPEGFDWKAAGVELLED